MDRAGIVGAQIAIVLTTERITKRIQSAEVIDSLDNKATKQHNPIMRRLFEHQPLALFLLRRDLYVALASLTASTAYPR